MFFPKFVYMTNSLCQRLGLTRSVRNKQRARSPSNERRRRESPPEVKDEWSESFAGGARGFAKQNHEGANTIFLMNKKLSLDKRLYDQKHTLFSNFARFCTPKRCTRVQCLVLKNNPNYVNFWTSLILPLIFEWHSRAAIYFSVVNICIGAS